MMRPFDLLAASVVGLALLPVCILIAVTITACNGLPVLFKQTRVGLNGRPFTLVKFRTMRDDQSVQHGFEAGSSRRVTRLGRVLRTTKLDELPQLLNVLVGHMAIVGPRPEVPDWIEACPDLFEETLRARPGLTDPASIVFRHEQSLLAEFDTPNEAYRSVVLPAKLRLSARYLRNRSVLSDLGVILATLLAVVGLPSRWSRIDARSLLQA